jgi:hypothetical protein
VRSDNGRVDHDAFHVGVSCEVLEHGSPDSAFSPAIKAFVNRVPVTIFFGKESPLSTTAGHPEDGVDEARAARQVLFCEQEAFAESGLTDVEVGSGLEKSKNFLPLLSGEFDVGHNLF